MKNIKEEDKEQELWYKEASSMTMENLPKFLNKLTAEYGHDYSTICHALAAGSIATAYAMNKEPQGGITGFQAGAVMWEFIKNWNHTHNKVGLRLVDYDKMLYPQYENHFNKTISSYVWENLQKTVSLELEKCKDSNGKVHENVYSHWKSIENGVIPFGYTIEED